MTKAFYDQLLTDFREAWAMARGGLQCLTAMASCSSFSPACHDAVCWVHLPYDTKAETFSAFGGPVVADKKITNEEARAAFKQLSGRAGAGLPSSFRDHLAHYVSFEDTGPAAWWLALLLHLIDAQLVNAIGTRLSQVLIPNPFELSISAIEECGLNTDHPMIPGTPTSDTTLPTSTVKTEKSEGIGEGSTPAKPTRKRPGRHRLSKEESQRRNDILTGWTKARNAGTSMKTFCRDNPPLTVKELERFVSWKAARNRRKGGN